MYNAFQLNFSPVPRSEAVGQGEICNSKIDHNSQESLSGSSFSTLLDQEEHIFVERSHPLVVCHLTSYEITLLFNLKKKTVFVCTVFFTNS